MSSRDRQRRRARRNANAARAAHLFAPDYDIVVVADDWKGPESGAEKGPVCLIGRLFRKADGRKIARLLDVLEAGDAADWHGSERRGLFWAGCYERVARELRALGHGTTVLEMLATVGEFRSPHIKAEWEKIIADPTISVWRDARRNAYARGLFRFAVLLHTTLAMDRMRGDLHARKILLVCDRQDWLSTSGASAQNGFIPLPLPTPRWLPDADIYMEVRCLHDDGAMPRRGFPALLGLIDSEVWAHGRCQTARLPDGSTLRARMLDWQDRGRPPGEQVISREDLNAIEESVGPARRDYAAYLSEFYGKAFRQQRFRVLEEVDLPRE